MNLVLPLLIWAATANQNATQQGSLTKRRKEPKWPTPSAPPPMPAFNARPTTPTADAGKTSTPLADLHNAPPKLAPASSAEPAAISAYKKKATSLLKRKLAAKVSPSSLSSLLRGRSDTSVTVSVANIQKILANRGVKLKQDGLYGPVTANAWKKVANAKGLTSTIARVSPMSAKVVSQTYDALSVPPIP